MTFSELKIGDSFQFENPPNLFRNIGVKVSGETYKMKTELNFSPAIHRVKNAKELKVIKKRF